MTLIEELATYLNDEGIGTFNPNTVGGNIFLTILPQTPDIVIAIYPTGGNATDGKLKYEEASVQLIARGTTEDQFTPYEALVNVYNKLQGFHHDTFTTGGFFIINCIGDQSAPGYIGKDSVGRYEYSLNFKIHYYNPSRDN